MAKSIKFTNDTYLDGSNVRIPQIAKEQNLNGIFLRFSTSASGWDAQVKELQDFIDTHCTYGSYFINCNMNGAHAAAMVEKASELYESFLLFSYSAFQWYRKYNGSWSGVNNIVTDTNHVDHYKLIYDGKLGAAQQDFYFNYNFKKGKTYDLFIEGVGASPVDYSVLPNSGWWTFLLDRIGGSEGNHYYEHINSYLTFRLDAVFTVHFTFQYLDNGIITVHGDWINRTNRNSLYSRHIMGASNNAFDLWTSLYFAGTFPAGMRTRVYER